MQEGQPDRLADLLEEAALEIERLLTAYSEEYDAHYNKETGEWLEDKCDDPECEFCVDRPEKNFWNRGKEKNEILERGPRK